MESDLAASSPTGLGSDPIRLDELSLSQCATVCRVDTTDGAADQLMAMGVCEGRKIELVQQGDPLIIRVLGSRLGVSARLARRVHVQTCDSEGCG